MSDSVWHLGCGAEKCAPHNLERVVEEMHDSIYDHLGLKCLNISNGSNGGGHGIDGVCQCGMAVPSATASNLGTNVGMQTGQLFLLLRTNTATADSPEQVKRPFHLPLHFYVDIFHCISIYPVYLYI